MNRPARKRKSRTPNSKRNSGKLPTKGNLRFDHFEPELAFQETRSIKVIDPDSPLPIDDYGFIEYYCADPTCDCQRVILQVWSEKKPGKVLATIGYGWENEAFYTKWMHGDSDLAVELKGPALESLQPQSALAEHLLTLFKTVLMKDEAYLHRLKTHYNLAKKKQGARV